MYFFNKIKFEEFEENIRKVTSRQIQQVIKEMVKK